MESHPSDTYKDSGSSKSNSSAPVVRMQTQWNYLKIEPSEAVFHIVDTLCRYKYKNFKVVRGKMNIRGTDVKMYTLKPEGVIWTFAGYAYKLKNLFEAEGMQVELTDATPSKLGKPNYDALDKLRPGQPEILAKLVSRRRCLVQSATGTGKTFLVCQLAKVYENASILVCSPGIDDVKSLRDRLSAVVGHVGMISGAKNKLDSVTVCTFQSAGKVWEAQPYWDIIVIDEVHRAACQTAFDSLVRFQCSKMVGLSASALGRKDGREERVKALCGGLAVDLTYKDAYELGLVSMVKYKFIKVDGEDPYSGDSWTAKQRWCFWRNKHRNKIVAKQARTWEDYGQTIIFVKTLDHALHLMKHGKLHDYELIYANMTSKKQKQFERMKLLPEGFKPMTAKRRDQLRRDFESGKLKKVISTFCWGTAVDFQQLKVIIRADGEYGPVVDTQLPGRSARKHEDKDYAVLIDFLDVFNSACWRRSQERRKFYAKTGFQPLDG